MISRRIVANVIFFFFGSVALIAALVVFLFNVGPTYSVSAIFPQSGGVFTGQEVTYRGVTVGRVGDLTVVRDPEGVEIDLIIEESFDEIPAEGIRARVMFKSAVGEQFVDLLPQTTEPPFLEAGDQIPIDRTEIPVQQEELLRLLASVLDGVPPEAVERLIDTLGTGLGGRGESLHNALAALDPVSELFANRTAELNRINRNADRLGDAFDATRSDFEQGIRSLADVSETLASSSDELTRLLEAGADKGEVLATLVAARKAQLDDILANLATLTRDTHEHRLSLRDILDQVGPFLNSFLIIFDEEAGRFRFGQVMDQPAPEPCSYGTPQRDPTVTGDAPYHPILRFSCEPDGDSSSATGPEGEEGPAPGPGPAPPSDGGDDDPPDDPLGPLTRILTDPLGQR